MGKTWLGKELWLTCTNEVGTMAKWSGILGKEGVNIEACCCYTMEGKANFMVVTSDNTKATTLLTNGGYTCTEKEVVITEMENKPGTCTRLTTMLAEAGVNIDYWYFSAGTTSPAWVVYNTTDNAKALKVLSECSCNCN